MASYRFLTEKASTPAGRGEILLSEGLWYSQKFPPVRLQEPFDWEVNPHDSRTWVWLYHQLAFSEALFAYDEEDGGRDGRNYYLRALKDWWTHHADVGTAPDYAWHDHGAAKRLESVLKLQRLSKRSISVEDAACISDIIDGHVAFLVDERNYSQGTNHGLDQSIALYLAASRAADKPWREAYAAIAVKRLAAEVCFSFASDGGHKENSVQYHQLGMMQLEKLKTLKKQCAKFPIAQIEGVDTLLTLSLIHI